MNTHIADMHLTSDALVIAGEDTERIHDDDNNDWFWSTVVTTGHRPAPGTEV